MQQLDLKTNDCCLQYIIANIFKDETIPFLCVFFLCFALEPQHRRVSINMIQKINAEPITKKEKERSQTQNLLCFFFYLNCFYGLFSIWANAVRHTRHRKMRCLFKHFKDERLGSSKKIGTCRVWMHLLVCFFLMFAK